MEETEDSYLQTFNVPLENPQVPNWNVLIRVLQPTEQEEEGLCYLVSVLRNMTWNGINCRSCD